MRRRRATTTRNPGPLVAVAVEAATSIAMKEGAAWLATFKQMSPDQQCAELRSLDATGEGLSKLAGPIASRLYKIMGPLRRSDIAVNALRRALLQVQLNPRRGRRGYRRNGHPRSTGVTKPHWDVAHADRDGKPILRYGTFSRLTGLHDLVIVDERRGGYRYAIYSRAKNHPDVLHSTGMRFKNMREVNDYLVEILALRRS